MSESITLSVKTETIQIGLREVTNTIEIAPRTFDIANISYTTPENRMLPNPELGEVGQVVGLVAGKIYALVDQTGGGGGTSDHGELDGLGDDDHSQYHNDARGDARYYPQATVDSNISAAISTHASNADAHHAHANKAELDKITDGDHDVRGDNPHGVTAVQAGADPAGTASTAVASHESTHDHSQLHSRQHALDSASDHTGIAGTEGNFMALDAGGLPVDSGSSASSFDAAGLAATAYTSAAQDLSNHEITTTTAHGGIVADTDSRLSDARTPTAHASTHASGQSDAITPDDIGAAPSSKGVTNGDSHNHDGGDGAQIDYANLANTPTLGTAAALNVAASGDAASTEVVKGDDTRMTNARTPSAHASTHADGGSDEITPASIGAASNNHNNTAHSEEYITSSGVTFANASANGETGTGANQFAIGNHTHLIDFLSALSQSPTSISSTSSLDTWAFGAMLAVSCNDITITLPDPTGFAGYQVGFIFTAGTGTYAKIARHSSESINGEAYDKEYLPGEMASYFCDGTDWIAQQQLRRIYCRIARTGDQAISDASYNKVQLNAVVSDLNNDFDSSTNYRFVAPVTGIYTFEGGAYVSGINSGDTVSSYLYVNGESLANGTRRESSGASPVSGIFYLSRGDYVELYVQSSDSSYTVKYYSGTFMQVTRTSN